MSCDRHTRRRGRRLQESFGSILGARARGSRATLPALVEALQEHRGSRGLQARQQGLCRGALLGCVLPQPVLMTVTGWMQDLVRLRAGRP